MQINSSYDASSSLKSQNRKKKKKKKKSSLPLTAYDEITHHSAYISTQ